MSWRRNFSAWVDRGINQEAALTPLPRCVCVVLWDVCPLSCSFSYTSTQLDTSRAMAPFFPAVSLTLQSWSVGLYGLRNCEPACLWNVILNFSFKLQSLGTCLTSFLGWILTTWTMCFYYLEARKLSELVCALCMKILIRKWDLSTSNLQEAVFLFLYCYLFSRTSCIWWFFWLFCMIE